MLKNGLWLFAICILILVIFLPSFSKIQDLKHKNAQYEEQIELLKNKRDKLVEERRLLEEDPVYLEKVARDKMGIAREGEVIFRLTPATDESKATVAGFGVE